MNLSRFLLQFLMLLTLTLHARSPGDADTSAGAADAAVPDSSVQTPARDELFVNPFAGSDAPAAADTADFSSNPRHDPAMHRTGIMTGVGSRKPFMDLLLDISLGYSLSRFSIESPFYSSRGQGDYLFTIGIIVPIKETFYFEVAFSNMQLKYTVDDSTADQMGSYFTTKAEESMNYVSLPLHIGMKGAFKSFHPYVYAACTPALLTSSRQFVKRKSYSLFLPDSAAYAISSVQDNETTAKRERYQVFAGGGAGVEIDYGYGVVYVDCCAAVALRETGYRDFSPSETRSRLLVFPVSAGLRFFL